MKNAFCLAKKEVSSSLNSWSGIFSLTFFLMLSGLFFSLLVLSYAKISVDAAHAPAQEIKNLSLTRFIFGSFFLNLAAILIFLVPALTMRSFSEERKQQTLELLFTYPLSDFEIVWGKFLGLVWFIEGALLLTAIYPLGLHFLFKVPLDWAPILMGYLGFWLLANAYLALGLFISSVAENQVVSAVLSFAALVIFWIFDWAAQIAEGRWAQFISALSPYGHYREFTLGIFDLSHTAYFILFHLFFIFLTLRAVESRHWKV